MKSEQWIDRYAAFMADNNAWGWDGSVLQGVDRSNANLIIYIGLGLALGWLVSSIWRERQE